MNYYSKHTFMFPFQWDYHKQSKQNHYNDRTNLDDFCRLFEQENPKFELTPFQIKESAEKFNEYTYFYAFARKALYYLDDNSLSRYYELEESNGEYHIEFLEKEGKVVKLLQLDSICVHVFETGIGIVSFNLTNTKYADKESVLAINEFGRRMYPQFMDADNRMKAKNNFLANRIYGTLGTFSFEEDFSAYENSIDVNATFLPPDYIKKVFGYKGEEKIGDIGKKFVFRRADEQKDTIRIRQITDDRMFFLCWYGNNEEAERLKITETEIVYADDFWYTYIFGDKTSLSINNKTMQEEQLKKSTYSRWGGYGTLYGVSRDSFVCLSSNPPFPALDVHMQTMYYQMAVLCLVQRASILRFGWEISQITNQIFREKKKPEKAIKALYENYIRFINQIYFREVTSQVQGIELYTKFQEAMNIEKEAKDLDGEMQELFNYLSVREQSKLGKVANLFLPVSLLAGILGINTIKFKMTAWEELGNIFGSISYFFTVVLFLWTAIVLTKQIINNYKK